MIAPATIASQDPTGIRLDVMAGAGIAITCGYAEGLASSRRVPVSFTFNGIEVIVKDGTDGEAALLRWQAETNLQAEAWHSSPEGRKSAREQEQRRIDDQFQMDDLLCHQPGPNHSLQWVVRWCVGLAKFGQRMDVRWSKPVAITALEACGYMANAHVGKPEEAFDNPVVMGEYIVGQVISCMKEGMPPHEMTIEFAKRGWFLP